MRANEWVGAVSSEPGQPKDSADLYDFGVKQTETGRLRRIKALEHENALLTRMVSETGIQIAHLRKLLNGHDG
jgi:hypothetical protein